MESVVAKPKIIALSASLRNARWGTGTSQLLDELKVIETKENLLEYVRSQAALHLEQFVEAGRAEGIPFDQLYANLKKQSGGKGLCNSEVGMAVALWSAYQLGCDIDYIPLGAYFSPNGKGRNLDELKSLLLEADGLLLCTPVYFGDRSSLASDLIEFVRADNDLREHMKGKPFAGVAVGAKRNGGQETTLVYQMMEMTSLGMLGLGNDSETTSQYGGTIVAGDIGTAPGDDYGLNTSMGTGRRLARVMLGQESARKTNLDGKVKVMFWILQDKDDYALNRVKALTDKYHDSCEVKVLEIDGDVARCLACDICPTHVGPDNEYRCIITSKRDEFKQKHISLLDWDVIVPVVYSPKERKGINNSYQRFIERTRYLRRGDYVFTDVLIMPLIFEELGAGECLDIRMLTSFVRHHAIMVKPNNAYIFDDKLINNEDVVADWENTLELAKDVAVARMAVANEAGTTYNPIGYVLSTEVDKQALVQERHEALKSDREQRRAKEASDRILSVAVKESA
jgi:multimeric flavodoxin WrbA